MGRRIRVGKGRSAVWVTGSIAEDITRDLREAVGPVLDELEAAAEGVLDAARKKWPVKSGKSRDSFRTVTTISGDGYRVEVTTLNKYRYVRYIKSSKRGKKPDATRYRSPLIELIRKPTSKERRRMKKVLPGILAKHLEREVLNG